MHVIGLYKDVRLSFYFCVITGECSYAKASGGYVTSLFSMMVR